MNSVAIRGKRIITPSGLVDGYLVIRDGKIDAICQGSCPKTIENVVDAGEEYVSPGFIDIHTHGAGGYDFMDGTVACMIGAAKAHLKHGTTALVPTTLTSTMEELFRTIDLFHEARRQMSGGPELAGLHLEGPYFSMEQRGAQDARYIKKPDKSEYREITNYAKGSIVRWSAAPELEGAMEFGDYLAAEGILASIGHSNAEYCHVKEACRHGYRLLTHFYCGMSGLTRRGGFRHLGVIESGYLLDDLDVEIIADGCHLPAELLQLIVRGKGTDHIILVTDSMRGAGMPEGKSVLGSLRNGQEVLVEDGVAKLCDRTAFAGSVATADRLVRVMNQQAGVAMQEAVKMITANPARILGMKQKGSLLPGMDADIVFFDENVKVSQIMVGGEWQTLA